MSSTSARRGWVPLPDRTHFAPDDFLDPHWWWNRVCVVTEQEEWATAAVDLCLKQNARPEILSWPEAEVLTGPVGALLVQVERVSDPRLELFELWSARAWQPFCVISSPAVRGSARPGALLDGFSYCNVLQLETSPAYWTELDTTLMQVLERRAWLVTWLADLFDSRHPDVVRALTALVLAREPIVTVQKTLWPASLIRFSRPRAGGLRK